MEHFAFDIFSRNFQKSYHSFLAGMDLNKGFCTIKKDGTRQGFGSLIDISSQKKKFGTTCICIVPDNVIKINDLLSSKGQNRKYTGEISIQKEYDEAEQKQFEIVQLLYFDTRLGICCFEIKYKSDAKLEKIQRYSKTCHKKAVKSSDSESIFVCKGPDSTEHFNLKALGELEGDILPVRIPYEETKGLRAVGSYPVFKKHTNGDYNFLGFVALREGTQCDLLLCNNLKEALCNEGQYATFSFAVSISL